MRGLIVILFTAGILWAGEVYEGVFELRDGSLIINGTLEIPVSKGLKITNVRGQEVPISSISAARVIEVEKDRDGKAVSIIIKGWWD